MSPLIPALLAGVILAPVIAKLAHRNLLKPSSSPLVDGAAAAAGAGVLIAAALAGRDLLDAATGLPLIVFGLAAAIVDVREKRLPDALTGPLVLATAAALATAAVVGADGVAALRAAVAAVAVTAVALALKAVRSAAIGWGDIKLLPSLGTMLGWWRWDAVLTAAFLWALLIALTAVIVSCVQRRGSAVVPYGPALLVGTFGGLVVSG